MNHRRHPRPCHLRGEVAGAWLAAVVVTVVAGLFDDYGWFVITTGLLLIALLALTEGWSR